jgi:hypothetical protein
MLAHTLWALSALLWHTHVNGSPVAVTETTPSIINDTISDDYNAAWDEKHNAKWDFLDPYDKAIDGQTFSPALRFEIGKDICRHQYCFFHEEWVIQVPEAWWKTRFHGRVDFACRAWKVALMANSICGFRMTECWQMGALFPSGGIGWLQARLTTCIGPNVARVESTFSQVFDIDTEAHEIHCWHGMRLESAIE